MTPFETMSDLKLHGWILDAHESVRRAPADLELTLALAELRRREAPKRSRLVVIGNGMETGRTRSWRRPTTSPHYS